MIIEFHDDVFKHGLRNFSFDLKIEKDCDMSLFQDFMSLISETRDDWDEDITVTFNITNEDE